MQAFLMLTILIGSLRVVVVLFLPKEQSCEYTIITRDLNAHETLP